MPVARLVTMLSLMLMSGCARCAAQRVASPISWAAIHDGLFHATFKHHGVEFHALRVDLKRNTLRIADARRIQPPVAGVAALALQTQALAAVNGTFFDEAEKPLGWLMSDGIQLNPVHDTSWWAALVERDEDGHRIAEVLTTEAIKSMPPERRASVRFAIQVGPRTVVDGKPVKLKNQTAERTAACVTTPEEVVLLVTRASISSNELAELMARPQSAGGLGCQNGLMFDGGPSTQLSIRTDALKLDVAGGWGVPNAVIVVPAP
jgi:uncharacterized protein YigE (DUF2233 family)